MGGSDRDDARRRECPKARRATSRSATITVGGESDLTVGGHLGRGGGDLAVEGHRRPRGRGMTTSRSGADAAIAAGGGMGGRHDLNGRRAREREQGGTTSRSGAKGRLLVVLIVLGL